MRFNGFTYATVLALLITSMSACGNPTANSGPAPSATDEAVNPAVENIMTRTSIRQYQPDRSISRDTVDLLLRAAMSAPTAVNKQPWAFVVIDSRESLDSLAEVLPYARMLRHAPLAIVTCGDLGKALEGEAREFWIQDVSAATENLLLAMLSDWEPYGQAYIRRPSAQRLCRSVSACRPTSSLWQWCL